MLVSCLTNTCNNLLVFFAVGCVALPHVEDCVIAPCRQQKILRNLSQVFAGRDTSVVSHKYAYESAGPFGRRLRCSSSRGNGHTGGFETRPYKSSRLADDQNALASS